MISKIHTLCGETKFAQMRTNQFQSLLNRLNKKDRHKDIFLSPISDNVDFGRYWDKLPSPKIPPASGDGPYSFYFIKNEDGIYVSVVLDMNHDLHWYVSPKHRKRGILTNAMNLSIIPDLASRRESQRISIDPQILTEAEVEASQAVAMNLGFVFKDSGDRAFIYELDLKGQKRSGSKNRHKGMEEERMEVLVNKINYLSRSLWLIENEVNAAFGNSAYSKKLINLVDEIKEHTYRLEDVYYDFKKKQ